MKRNAIFTFLVIAGCLLSACGKESSSSSSSSSGPPSGFTSEQKDRYNNLTPEGKEYVKQQMDAYDRVTKR